MDLSICDNMVGFPKYSHNYEMLQSLLSYIAESTALTFGI